MDTRTRLGVLASLMMAGAVPAAAQASPETSTTPATPQATSEAPSGGASSALIAQGDAVFHGPGNCYACHGSKGEGLVGPNLTDSEWIHSKGTLAEIEAQILHGVPKEESKSGIPMPPKGGATISDEDVKACAAYVHSLSQKGS
ncbi:MAG: cytochrome c oxidase cbb3-type subunit [Gemmatimonadales bacterium]|jgi:mono/diheme cytochrome c family protein|nr:cytochrome c oxidase cbb3-type subunit [Gemmatimonadales bacterium]